MGERQTILDEPETAEAADALRQATERAERAEQELARLKRGATVETRSDRSEEAHATGDPELTGIEALRQDGMMAHLLDGLGRGEDIGHYGRLVFTMVARHFLTEQQLMDELTRDRDFDENQARQMVRQVRAHDYSPPRRERILEWQAEQSFPIIPDPADPDSGNVYKSLRFPKGLYQHIGQYQEEKAESEEAG
ncbi:MAG TPA: hypothetical protein VM865_09290 [Acidobacteriaceae bacterium]|jgi:hypothetical protein|nr:hypothetical protein [Acidobacteriaceae bacterium]